MDLARVDYWWMVERVRAVKERGAAMGGSVGGATGQRGLILAGWWPDEMRDGRKESGRPQPTADAGPGCTSPSIIRFLLQHSSGFLAVLGHSQRIVRSFVMHLSAASILCMFFSVRKHSLHPSEDTTQSARKTNLAMATTSLPGGKGRDRQLPTLPFSISHQQRR